MIRHARKIVSPVGEMFKFWSQGAQNQLIICLLALEVGFFEPKNGHSQNQALKSAGDFRDQRA